MKKNCLFVLLLFITLSSFCVQQRKIDKIEFSSITRGSHQNIIITKDSVSIAKQDIGDTSENRSTRKLKSQEWDKVLKTLNDTPLDQISLLKSPTKNRASDGARHSTITITDEKGESYIHSFDNENPNEKLKALMQCIRKTAKI